MCNTPLPPPPGLQVLGAALDLLRALCSQDHSALRACCQLGFCPAVLRFALPSTPLDIRLQVGLNRKGGALLIAASRVHVCV